MRFAAIADIHGNHLALEAVLADIRAHGIEDVVNLGDFFSGPLEAGRTADLLTPLGLTSVRGNHDRYLIEQDPASMHASDAAAYRQLTPSHLEWLRGLPFDAVYRGEAYLCHATPKDDNLYWLESVSPQGQVFFKPFEAIEALAEGIDLPLILCGHSHIPRAVRLSDGRLIVNPGSVGCPAYDDVLPYYHKVEAGHPLASYAILEKTAAGWMWQFRTVAYDHMAQSALAAERGRADWASALATGWVR
ncbi:YfcE family phosphodiesterase [Rhizobium sp. L9]|uniref:metallophosphoesterase family protein n=1 Tax=Rhizobium TaxID=379 RepID=UPI000BE8001D|nr:MULTISPECIES: metallophosphoesterase family protein [Rhizobium]MBB3351134.1 diadenosine tetraphosphatase ApaH/serine/threonine PP2A family protein phosphatase [Rhizobium sp. BK049]MBX5136260.1 metallophosphoesterase family protein [Rhizobium lentis]MBX5138019.1 metallophosphoesterase family protein [Rhizobium lentis]MBX5152444.1 metallophosphoesterase family protein [Rhizobium lentis]MBX5175734.1 metallophosphoesterase family protein [Rhizobium lentis]